MLAALGWLGLGQGIGVRAAEPSRVPQATVLAVSGRVEFQPSGTDTWYLASTQQVLHAGDQLRTAERSRAVLRLRDRSVLPVREGTQLRLMDRPEGPWIRLLRGVAAFFHRDEPGQWEVEGAGLNAAVRGTEFAFEVRDDGSAIVTLFDGALRLTRGADAPLELTSGEVAMARPGEPLRKTAVLEAGDWTAVQWALYYPSILDPEALGWTEAPAAGVAGSWRSFRLGNPRRGLELYPADRTPESGGEKVFLAALLLAVGAVEPAERWLIEAERDPDVARWASAHRRWIDRVRRGRETGTMAGASDLASATEWMLASYDAQAGGRLMEARDAARRATEISPRFGAAWARLAELEFVLQRRRPAEEAIDQALRLAPENAEGWALLGFLRAARNRVGEAEPAFDRALELDPWLGHAWLGRGLCRIRRGDLEGGRDDLVRAAAAEPQRALFRSYLGKAWGEQQPFRVRAWADRARHELELARRWDPGDPTPWLYSALLNQQENRINEAIDDLRESLARNDHRYLYRSRLGLDQDRAVRSANLANLHADAGLSEIAVREATRAVNTDYANAAAHLFLANSYDALRDPRQIQLRYETPWLGEYLVGNLLAPVGAGSLSQAVARNEYSKLFERDRAGVVNRTEWTSNGDWLQQAAQFGQFGNLAYALDADYRSWVGQRPNNDLEALALTATAKVQAGPDDHFLVQAGWYDLDAGDVLQRYDPADAIPGLRLSERHEPLGVAGWHHEWGPGNHTLVLVAPWNARQSYVNPANRLLTLVEDRTGAVNAAAFATVPLVEYRTRLGGVSAEAMQLWQAGSQTLVAGVRYQNGGFDTTATLDPAGYDPEAPAASVTDPGLERWSIYAYDQWQVCRAAWVTAGVTYDHLTFPWNFRTAPVTDGSETEELVSPKLGLTLSPWRGATWRGAYTRSLSGASYDQSYRLEPVQVAGFTQAYRGLFPESLVGSVSAQEMSTAGVAWDQDFPWRMWITASGEWLTSDASRGQGAFRYSPTESAVPTVVTEDLAFDERVFSLTLGQLIGRDLALSVRYRLAEAELETDFAGLPAGLPFFPEQRRRERSVLQQWIFGARYRLPSGFFASWDSTWSRQSNHEDAAGRAGDDFWQHDVWVGWRFWRRRAELAAGLLNVTDQDYRLHPLNAHAETYRDRTFSVVGRFDF